MHVYVYSSIPDLVLSDSSVAFVEWSEKEQWDQNYKLEIFYLEFAIIKCKSKKSHSDVVGKYVLTVPSVLLLSGSSIDS